MVGLGLVKEKLPAWRRPCCSSAAQWQQTRRDAALRLIERELSRGHPLTPSGCCDPRSRRVRCSKVSASSGGEAGDLGRHEHDGRSSRSERWACGIREADQRLALSRSEPEKAVVAVLSQYHKTARRGHNTSNTVYFLHACYASIKVTCLGSYYREASPPR